MAPFPSRPQRVESVELHALKAVALDAVDTVQQCNPLVDERVLRRHEVRDAAILVEDALREQLDLREVVPARIAAAGRVREDRRIGLDLLEAFQIEPVVDEVAGERLRARVLQHALDLAAQHALVTELAAHGEVAQLVVGNRVPKEERQLRRQRRRRRRHTASPGTMFVGGISMR